MNKISLELIDTLSFLGTGFLAAWVFYGLTSFSRPTQFEQVIQAFIFTTVVQALVALEETVGLRMELFDTQSTELRGFLSLSINAFTVGLVFAFFANTDYFHLLLRKMKITRETSFPSEWFGNFSEKETYVVLHLKDERRIYGWPMEWPSNPSVGHFSLADVSWLENNEEKLLEGVDSVLIQAEDVKWVEFMRMER